MGEVEPISSTQLPATKKSRFLTNANLPGVTGGRCGRFLAPYPTWYRRDPDHVRQPFFTTTVKTVVERDLHAFSRATWARTAQAPVAQLAQLRRAAGAP